MSKTYFTQQAIDGSWHVVFRDDAGQLQSAHDTSDADDAKVVAFVLNIAQAQAVEVVVL